MIRLGLAIAFGCFTLGCAEIRSPSGPSTFPVVEAPAGTTVFFDRDVQAIFDRSCTGGCHEPAGSGVRDSGLDLTSGVSLGELLDATASKNGPHVIPGDPDNSLLVWKIEGVDPAGRKVYFDPMPQGRSALAASEIAGIREWISQGALRTVAPPMPAVLLASAARDSATVELRFDKPLDAGSAADTGHYSVSVSDEEISVQTAVLEAGDRVLLTLGASMPAGVTVAVTVVGLVDQEGHAILTPVQGEARYTPVVSFSQDIVPAFEQGCAFVGCHAADERFPPGAGLVLNASAAWSQLTNVPSGQLSGLTRVVPGSPGESYLLSKMDGSATVGDQMPVGGPFLTPAELQVFRLWIEQGANDN